MKNTLATKTMQYLTRKQLIDIADKDECWDKMTRAAIRHLRKKSKDQQSKEFLESHLQEDVSEIV